MRMSTDNFLKGVSPAEFPMPQDLVLSNRSRRQWLRWLGALPVATIGGLPAWAGASPAAAVASTMAAQATVLAACWERVGAFQVGLLTTAGGTADPSLQALAALNVPTRAHGLVVEAGGSVLVVARRPGDWLLRWYPDGRPPQWQWIEAQRALNGHAVVSADGRTIYTTETDLDTGAGCIGVRDARTLVKRDEWPTHGIDAHQLVWDRAQPHRLIVAHGGVITAPETGRAKLSLSRMDSSLVRLDARTGRLDAQWRLEDPRLSLRHLAWSGDASTTLGIAMQAEHDDADARAVAPVLALFDGDRLQTAPSPQRQTPPSSQTLAGYGGDIAAHGDGFFVSCPRAGGLAHYSTSGRWRGFMPLPEACALAVSADRLWTGGRPGAAGYTLSAGGAEGSGAARVEVADLRLDNHWVAVPPVT